MPHEKSCPPKQGGLGHFYWLTRRFLHSYTNTLFIPHKSTNVSSLLNHTRALVNASNDLTPTLGDLISGFDHEALVEKVVTSFGNYHLNMRFLLHVPVAWLWHLPPVRPDSCQKSHFHMRPLLRAHYRWGYQSHPQGTECWRGSSQRNDHQVTWELAQGNERLPPSPLSLLCIPLAFPALWNFSKDIVWR